MAPLVEVLEADVARPPARALKWIGLGLAWLATAFSAALAWKGLGIEPSSCASDCAAMAHAPGASIYGIPILAFALGLHLVLWLVIGLRAFTTSPKLIATLATLMFGLAALLLVGTAVYLVWGLVLGLTCTLCLTLHAAALVAALGVFLAGLGEPVFTRGTARHVALGMVLAALVMLLGTVSGASHRTWTQNDRTYVDADIASLCEIDTCPSAAVFRTSDLPEAALVVSQASPTVLLWIDFECTACRRELATLKSFLTEHIMKKGGLALLLRAEVAACDPSARGGDPSRCEAPAALICATRHGRPTSALAYLEWELAASPGFYTLEDRRAWLAQRVDPAARQCLDDELRMGRHGTLARHAEAARNLGQLAQAHVGCGPNQAEPAWWCFAATPSLAVFSDTAPPAMTVARELALSQLSGSARGRLLDSCVGGP